MTFLGYSQVQLTGRIVKTAFTHPHYINITESSKPVAHSKVNLVPFENFLFKEIGAKTKKNYDCWYNISTLNISKDTTFLFLINAPNIVSVRLFYSTISYDSIADEVQGNWINAKPIEGLSSYILSPKVNPGEKKYFLLNVIFSGYPSLILFEAQGVRRRLPVSINPLRYFTNILFFLVFLPITIFFWIKTKDRIYVVFLFTLLAYILPILIYKEAIGENCQLQTFISYISIVLWYILYALILDISYSNSKYFIHTIILAFLILLEDAFIVFRFHMDRGFLSYAKFCFEIVLIGVTCLTIYEKIKQKKRSKYYFVLTAFLIPWFLIDCIYHLIPILRSSFVILQIIYLVFISIAFSILTYRFFEDLNKKKVEERNLLIRQERTLFEGIISALENDRSRISKDLHDELGNYLAVIKMKLQKNSLNQNSEIISLLDKVSSDISNVAHDLMPPEFYKTKLSVLLESYYRHLNREGIIQFNYTNSGEENHFTKSQELMIYRIIMEITSNIIRHSTATQATIQFNYYNSQLEIHAKDNGQGFEIKNANGIGLSSIDSRVKYLEGSLDINSNQNGTSITIQIPYNKENGTH